jgi:hypothetical protein
MYIHVMRDFRVALEETEDFKRFKLVIDAPRADLARIGTALAGIATLNDDGHAWVNEEWLRRSDSAASWQDGLTAMLAVAKKYGWVDEQTKAVRAHVEWPGESTATA